MSELSIILGADGFLGRHMARILAKRGHQVHCIGRAFGDFSEAAIVDRALAGAPRATKIFHLVTRQRTGPIQYGIQGELLMINARIHLNVLEAWRRFQPQAKLISTGSSCAFPERDMPIDEEQFQAGQVHDSVRGYALAKQLLAVGSEVYGSQYGLRYLHLFLATVYGPGDHRAKDRTHFMTGMIDRALREKSAGAPALTVWGSPQTVRDLLYVDDQIDAILNADATFENERLNVTSNAPVTIGECAEALLEAVRWDVPIDYPSGTFQGTDYKTLDSSRFLKKVGWTPRWSLTDGIRETI